MDRVGSVPSRGLGRWPRLAIAALALFSVGAAGAWATLTVLRPAEDPLTLTEHTYVEVSPGSVGTSISLSAVAAWDQVPVAANQASGIVTSLVADAGAEVSQGSTLYTVGLRPVVAAQGEIPMFRDIGDGAVGEDVRQLQQMLATLGHYDGTLDGKAERGTVTAIKSWQADAGVEESGVVGLGDVVFLPQLPARVAFDHELIARGKSLGGGENGILGLSETPRFWLPVTEAQAASIPVDGTVEVSAPDGELWQGVAGEQKRNGEDGTVTIAITGVEGAVLCGGGCAQIPMSGQTALASKIVTVEQVDGLVVPSAALITSADGTTAVIDSDDNRIPVEIVASAKGMSVINGVDEGLRVRVPAADDADR